MNEAPDITVHFPGALRDYVDGKTDVSLPATTVLQALDLLEQRYPTLHRNIRDETGKVRRHLNIFVNTSNVRDLDGLETKLAPGDIVTILTAVSGG
jgi:MoaD family protein